MCETAFSKVTNVTNRFFIFILVNAASERPLHPLHQDSHQKNRISKKFTSMKSFRTDSYFPLDRSSERNCCQVPLFRKKSILAAFSSTLRPKGKSCARTDAAASARNSMLKINNFKISKKETASSPNLFRLKSSGVLPHPHRDGKKFPIPPGWKKFSNPPGVV